MCIPHDGSTISRALAAAGGPLAGNGLHPGQAGAVAQPAAMAALGHGYAIGCAVCAACTLAAAVATLLVMRTRRPVAELSGDEEEAAATGVPAQA